MVKLMLNQEKINSYCISSECPRFTECKRSILYAEQGATVIIERYLSFGSGTLSEGVTKIEFHCGPNSNWSKYIEQN